MIKIGEAAPGFENVTAYKKGQEEFPKINLSDYKGSWLVLFFYPRDFTFVCPTEIKEFAKFEEEFEKCGCKVLGASTDSEFSHKAWFERDLDMVEYPVLADTTQKVSDSYQVLGPDGGAQRGTFIIDPEGVIRWLNVSDNAVGRSVKEVHRALKALQSGGLCPVEWSPGEKTLGKA
ncbi:MAG: thioredoxin peroxidase [Candidatus Harrisonbacteria bacterium CG10_big_fil_rev_8_21_14_0_10_45_28]|uniref:Thioredoxin peroxidase n=1 Tax=Candidatus Harrisonbacteria bacterium CG10_big_fil_rev_8_21_14_0_10_45_28 TaxID=1974586 RepID=A0A2H0UND9_9BACT|nr:MAG: thioredoxin peroxidase [Candidatus Harrisonbacteria bacterium CG10_big_fil_rev_8_21_14_0_10_45_28]